MVGYEAKFTKLAHFAPHIVVDESTRARKFLHGLRPGIRIRLAHLLLTQYSNIVNRALVVEQDSEDFKESQESKKRHRPFEAQNGRNFGRNQPTRLANPPLPP